MFKLPLVAGLLAAVAASAGIFLGLKTSEAERAVKVQTVAEYLKEHNIKPSEDFVEARLPRAVVVGDLEHDFGHIGYQDKIKIEFKIKNTGGGELRIDEGKVSCGLCLRIEVPFENLPEGVEPAPEAKGNSLLVAPGATASVFVWFSQKEKQYETFADQTATFRTSDPRNSVIEFRIKGRITKAYRLVSDRFRLADLTVGSGFESRLGIFGYEKTEPLRIEKVEFLTEADPRVYAVAVEPMPEEDVKAEPGATSGYNLVLTITNPPLGKINQHLRLHVANAEPKTMDIPVEGNVVSNIQVISGGANPRAQFSPSQTYLDWSVVDGKTGDSVDLIIRVKLKPGDAPVEFKIKEIYPSDVLQAELGESIKTSNGQMVPLKIRIPAGSKPVNFRSLSADAKPARVVIETNDPATKEIVVGVRFGIE